MAVARAAQSAPDPVVAQFEQLIAAYKTAADKINAQLQAASLTDFQKFRLGEHKKQIKAITTALTAELRGIKAGISHSYGIGVDATRKALETQNVEIGALNFGNMIHTRGVQAVTDQMTQDLVGANQALEEQSTRILRRIQAAKLEEAEVNRIITQGLVTGETERKTTKRLTDYIKNAVGEGAKVEVLSKDGKVRKYDPAYYAELVSRTRTREAVVAGNVNGAVEWGVKTFQVTLHEGACPQCVPYQGKVYSLDGEDGFPILDRRPPFHPHCVLPETAVFAPGKLSASVSTYVGTVIEIGLSNAARLTVTPNHMLLTTRGLVAAQALREGDEVLCSTVCQGIETGDPDDDERPTAIKQIVRAFAESPGVAARAVPVAPEDFHGDGRFLDGEVNVVTPDCLLGDSVEPVALQEFFESTLDFADMKLLGLDRSRTLAELLFRLGFASKGGMCGSRLLHPLFREHLGRLQPADLAQRPYGYGVLLEDVVDDALADAVVAHKVGDGLAGDVSLADGSLWECGAESGANLNAVTLECPANRVDPNPKLLRDIVAGLSGEVETAYVTVKRELPYSGHVYDLQTVSGLYIANGVVSSNCEHNLVPYVGDARPSKEVGALKAVSRDPSVLINSPADYKAAVGAAMDNWAVKKTVAEAAAAEATQHAAVAGVEEAIAALDAAPFGPQFTAAHEAVQAAVGDLSGYDHETVVKPLLKKLADVDAAKNQALDQLTSKQLTALAKAGGLKNYSKGTVDDLKAWLSASTKDDAKVSAQVFADKAKLKAEAAKVKKALKAEQAKAAAAAQKAAQEAAEAAQGNAFLSPQSRWAELDAAWENGSARTFTFVKDAKDLGGAHPKEIWADEAGEKWLFKPFHSNSKAYGSSDLSFLTHTEEACYKVQRLIDPDAVEVRYIELGGRKGSIQRMAKDLAPGWDRSIDPKLIPQELIPQIQREHVLDWLMSNHDGHAEQFIVGKNGHVWGIDKGQAFKYFPNDKLSINYNPTAYGSEKMLMNGILAEVKAGRMSITLDSVAEAVSAIETLSDDAYRQILSRYATLRFPSASAQRQFLDAAVARKHSLRQELEEFYSDILGRKVTLAKAVQDATPSRLTQEAKQIIADAKRAKAQGKSLPFDGGDIEDQNLLVYGDTYLDKKRTVVEFKLRPEAERKFLDGLMANADRGALQPGDFLPEDKYFPDLLKAVKTVNNHASDLNYNMVSVDAALAWKSELETLATTATGQVKAMAKQYLAVLEEVEAKVAAQTVGAKMAKFERYLRQAEDATSTGKPLQMSEGKYRVILHNMHNRELDVANDSLALSDQISVHPGRQYEFVFDGGRLRYTPSDDANLWPLRGRVELMVEGEVSPESVEKAIKLLEMGNLDARVATAADRELLYLTRSAYVAKLESDTAYRAMLTRLDGEGASTETRVSALRDFWSRKLDVPDVTQLPQYNPAGDWEHCAADPSIRAGRWSQYRFDLTEQDVKDYRLTHSNTNFPGGWGSFWETVLDGTQSLTPTTEKLRIGVNIGGMSPSRDLETGGASYVFTRLTQASSSTARRPGSGTIVWKGNATRRLDAIVYDGDKYGETTAGFVTRNRRDFASWDSVAGATGNETIFKGSMSLIDDIESIGAGSQEEKRRIVAALRAAFGDRLPDGRKVEDIVKL